MIEDLLSELERPIRAIKMLLILHREYVEDDMTTLMSRQPREIMINTLAIGYAINLVNKDIRNLKRKYYKRLVKERYND